MKKQLLYTGSGTLAGLAAGAVVGAIGALMPVSLREPLLGVLLVVVLILGLIELSGGRAPMLQRDIETPQSWLFFGPVWWPIANGAALGAGFTTRIGFPVAYLVPISGLATASPVAAALIWGLFGFLRTSLAWVLLGQIGRSRHPTRILDQLAHGQPLVRRVMGGTAVAVCAILAYGI